MKKKTAKIKEIQGNVIGLPIKNRRVSGKIQVYTCSCGGQLFALCDNGTVLCHGCRTKQTKVKFRVI